MKRIFVAMTGASGAVYGVRLVRALLEAGAEVHLSLSKAAARVLETEMSLAVDLQAFDPAPFLAPGKADALHVHAAGNLLAGPASGTFLTAGMVICPCSMGTLARIAAGLSRNLIERAADAALKERRPLVLVPRETPFSAIHLRNMLRLTRAGATILPAMPGFYHRPRAIEDLVDFVVAKILDQLAIPHALVRRWGSEGGET